MARASLASVVNAATVARRLGEALRRLDAASAAQDYAEALRWADRANRLSPSNPFIVEVLGRLYARLGEPRRALGHLREAFERNPTSGVQAAVVDTLFELKRERQGFATLEAALRRFAVRTDDELSACARRHTVLSDLPAPGWVGLRPDLTIVGEVRAALMDRLQISVGGWGSPVRLAADPALGGAGWRFEAPVEADADGLISADSGGAVLIGSDALFPPDFALDGRCDALDGRLRGWVGLQWCPWIEPELELSWRGAPLQLALHRTKDDFGRHAFEADLQEGGVDDGQIDVLVRLPGGGSQLLPDSPALVVLPPPPQGTGAEPSVRALRRRLSEVKVDVVVPVYGGLEATLTCLQSVQRHSEGVCEVIVVDDASPEDHLRSALQQMAAAGEITLLRNPQNLGFVASVNRGLELYPGHDTVVLNSDTEVYPGWLEGLRAAAYSASNVGSVTPLTNAGAVVSYPAGLGSPCTSEGGARIAQIARDVNPGFRVDIPTGVGFCWYVRQDCKAAVGPLDAACFGRGYGEENDFSLRASALRWRHLVAADVFVRHLEGQSFGSGRTALMERNSRLLLSRHPDYDDRVDAFIKDDPLLPARRRIDERRLVDAAGAHVLLISNALPGGVSRFVSERRDAIAAEGRQALLLKPWEETDALEAEGVELTTSNATLTSLRYGRLEGRPLEQLLRRLDIQRIELHHFLGVPVDMVDLALGLGVEIEIYLHDYSWICPRLDLLGGEGRYCGEPDLEGCDDCTRTFGSALGPDWPTRELRARSAKWLASASRVIAPCEDVVRRIARYFPKVAVEQRPWESEVYPPAASPEPSDAPMTVAVIAALGEQKGYALLKACAEDAEARQLPLQFVLFGFSIDDGALERTGRVFVTGRFEEEEIDQLIARERPDVALFASLTPETWCFSLSPALRAGLPILAFDHGAVAERVRVLGGHAALVPSFLTPAALNTELLKLGSRPVPVDLPMEPSGATMGVQEPGLRADVPEGWDAHEAADDAAGLVLPDAPPAGEPAAAGVVSEEVEADPERKAEAEGDGSASALDQGVNFKATEADMNRTANPETLARASVQVLALGIGLYRFLVSAAAPSNRASTLILPAVQVTAGPGVDPDSLDYMTSPGRDGSWLFEQNDTIILRVKRDNTPIFITSYTTPGSKPLQIEVQRVDGDRSLQPGVQRTPQAPPAVNGALFAEAQRPSLIGSTRRRSEDGRMIAPTRVIAHISGRGDVLFVDQPWIGVLEQRLPIEGFIIEPLSGLRDEDIEYKVVVRSGEETPWTPGGVFCGTRQRALPLIGFAVRVRPSRAGEYECRYSAIFCSGARTALYADGAPVLAPAREDALQALQISFLQKRSVEAPQTEAASAARIRGGSTLDSRSEPLDVGGPSRALAPAPASERPRRASGPRFSVFREDGA